MPFEIFDSPADDANDREDALFADDAVLSEEGDWPEELLMLGSQLSADAARLASLYPAEPRTGRDLLTIASAPDASFASPTGVTGTGWMSRVLSQAVVGHGARWVTAAAILVVATIGTFTTFQSLKIAPIPEQKSTAPMQVAVNSETAPVSPQDAMSYGEPGSFEETGFEDLSSPAQEALLDLFEDNQLSQASLSI